MYEGSRLLENLVRGLEGNSLIQLINSIFQSNVFLFILFVVGIFILVRRKNSLKFLIYFWIGWLSLIPLKGKPLLYFLINEPCKLISNATQIAFSNMKALPPVFVFNSLLKASATKIMDFSVRKDIYLLLDNCTSGFKNNNGLPLSIVDLFAVNTKYFQMGGRGFGFNFDTKYLMNREFSIENKQVNCFELLDATIVRIRSLISQEKITKNLVTEGDPIDSSTVFRMEQLTANLAQTSSIENIVSDDYHHTVRSAFNRTQFFENVGKINKVNEKLNLLPSLVPLVKRILDAVFPLICLSIFFCTWRFVFFWSFSWSIAAISPWIFYISRLFSNTLILYINGIGKGISELEVSVNFSIASKMLENTSVIMNAFLNLELGIWVSLIALIPFYLFFIIKFKSGEIKQSVKVSEKEIASLCQDTKDYFQKILNRPAGARFLSIKKQEMLDVSK